MNQQNAIHRSAKTVIIITKFKLNHRRFFLGTLNVNMQYLRLLEYTYSILLITLSESACILQKHISMLCSFLLCNLRRTKASYVPAKTNTLIQC